MLGYSTILYMWVGRVVILLKILFVSSTLQKKVLYKFNMIIFFIQNKNFNIYFTNFPKIYKITPARRGQIGQLYEKTRALCWSIFLVFHGIRSDIPSCAVYTVHCTWYNHTIQDLRVRGTQRKVWSTLWEDESAVLVYFLSFSWDKFMECGLIYHSVQCTWYNNTM